MCLSCPRGDEKGALGSASSQPLPAGWCSELGGGAACPHRPSWQGATSPTGGTGCTWSQFVPGAPSLYESGVFNPPCARPGCTPSTACRAALTAGHGAPPGGLPGAVAGPAPHGAGSAGWGLHAPPSCGAGWLRRHACLGPCRAWGCGGHVAMPWEELCCPPPHPRACASPWFLKLYVSIYRLGGGIALSALGQSWCPPAPTGFLSPPPL